MNIHVITDLEGISGVCSIEHINEASSLYLDACEHLMLDTNAVVAGLFDGGALSVSVTDGHGGGGNFIKDMLDSRAQLINLTELYNSGLHKSIDAVVLVGAHAMAGTKDAFLDHTQSSVRWSNYYVNGMRCGEMVQGALFFGAYGAPVVFASGDIAACDEAVSFFGNISTAPVKKALSRDSAECFEHKYCMNMLHDKAAQSISLVDNIKPFKMQLPLEIKVEFTSKTYCEDALKKTGISRIDDFTVIKKVESITNYSSLLF